MLTSNITKLNNPSRNAISAALILIAAIAMYNRIVAPHVNYLFAMQQYEPVVSNVAREKELITNALKTKKTRLQELGEQLSAARNSLFNHTEAKAFFGDIEAIAKDAGCTLRSLSFVTRDRSLTFARSQNALHIVANSATLSFTGSYENIVELLQRLQNQTRKVWIDSIKITIFDIQSAQLKCDTTVTIYVLQDKETAPDE